MKRLAIALTLLAALFLHGAEKLRIADATDSDGSAVTRILLTLAAEQPQLEISFRRIDAGSAFEKFEAGDFDVVLVNGGDLPRKFRDRALRYSTGAFIAVVNIKNPLRDIGVKDLRLLIDTPRPRWELVGGSASEIHRCVVLDRNGVTVGAKMLALATRARDMLTFQTVGEAFMIAENDPVALVWGPFTASLPMTMVALKVHGTAPTRAEIRAGRYPLSVGRFAVGSAKPNGPARRFLELLRSGEFAKFVEEDNEIPELPELR